MFHLRFSHLFFIFRSWGRPCLRLASGFSCNCPLFLYAALKMAVLGTSDLPQRLPSSAYILPPCTFLLNLPLIFHFNFHLILAALRLGFCAWNPSGHGALGCESVLWAVPPGYVSVTGRKWVCKQASVDVHVRSCCCSLWKGSTLSSACKELWDLAIKPPFKYQLFKSHLS